MPEVCSPTAAQFPFAVKAILKKGLGFCAMAQAPACAPVGTGGPDPSSARKPAAPQATVEGTAEQFEPLEVRVVEGQPERRLWTELIERLTT